MEAELAALASTAAGTVVELLATDAWQQGKNAVGALWRRVHPEQVETIEAGLDGAREELTAARLAGDEHTEQVRQTEWQSWLLPQLRRLLTSNPELRHEVHRMVEELRSALPDSDTAIGHMEMRADASGSSTVNQAGRDINIER